MRLHEDGFDHYGTTTAYMLDGVYATAANCSLSTAHVATGTHSLYIESQDSNSSITGPRLVLPTAIDKVGAIGRFYFASQPAAPDAAIVFDFLSTNALQSQLMCTVGTNGQLRFTRGQYYGVNGGNGTLVAESGPLLGTSSFNHLEVQVYIHASAGWVRAAVNGIHRYEATGLNTQFDTSKVASIANHIGYYTSTGGTYNSPFWLDDYQIYDFTGTAAVDTDFCPTVDGTGKATDYIGELDVRWQTCDGNTAEDDWGKSTGTSAFPLVGKSTPDDSTYIYSTAAGDLTEQTLEDLPAEVNYIRGLTVWQRLSKSDSGAAQTQGGMESNGSSTDATARPVTVVPTYWRDQVNLDPDTAARWTREAFNDAHLRITRSA